MSSDEQRQFRIRGYRRPTDNRASFKPAWRYEEPVEAVDAAEHWLDLSGVKGESFVEILFNGSSRPMAVVRLLDMPEKYGIWNSFDNPWPIDYVDEAGGVNLHELGISPDRPWLDPSWEGDQEGEGDDEDEQEDKGRMPRVQLFSRFTFNGHKRKRVETDMQRTNNVMECVVGKLDLRSWLKPRQQERDQRVKLRVVERDDGISQRVNVFLDLPAGSVIETEERWGRVSIKALDIPLDLS